MTHSLSLHDITKDYGQGPVLSGISLDIQPGETVAVMGPSGSGKSTLLHCMSGVLTPTDGAVFFGETNIAKLSDTARSRLRLQHFGFVFQDGQLLPELTNVDNVALPAMLTGSSRGAARTRAQALLDQLGLGGLALRRPGDVSGGQAQRVAIARALIGPRRVLLADEPTGALDTATGEDVMNVLRARIDAGASGLLVTHEPRFAAWADRVVMVRDGRLSEPGAPQAVRPGQEEK